MSDNLNNNNLGVNDSLSILPLMYMSNSDNNIYWICDKDMDNKITSMFFKRDEPDPDQRRYFAYFNSIKDALYQQELLVKEGWIKCKKPEMNLIQESEKKPNRAQRRLKEKLENKKKLEKK